MGAVRWQKLDSSHLLGVGQGVSAAIVSDGDITLLDVYVGRSILAHGAQLHQVAVWLELLQRLALVRQTAISGALLSVTARVVSNPDLIGSSISICLLPLHSRPLSSHNIARQL